MNKKVFSFCFLAIWAGFSLTSTAMSQTQDAHSQHSAHPSPSVATESNFQVRLSVPEEIIAAQIFTLKIDIQDNKGQNIPVFEMFQEKRMHLIMVSDDLLFFIHLHPEYKENGHFEVKAVFPFPGSYTLFCSYKLKDRNEVTTVLKAQAAERKQASVIDTTKTEQTVGDTKITLAFSPSPIKAGQEVAVIFELKQAADNKPVMDLQPYLGEKGHLVIIRKSQILGNADYVHAHAVRDTSASVVKFMTNFPKPGVYKLWGQFDRNGKVLTVAFGINVEH